MARGFLPYDLDQQYLLPQPQEWLPRSTWPSSSPMWSKLPGSVGHHAGIPERLSFAATPGITRPCSQAPHLRLCPGQGLLAQTGAGHLRGPARSCRATATPTTTPSPLSANAISRRWLVSSPRSCVSASRRDWSNWDMALDGSKLKASASKHKAMSYARLCRSRGN